MKDLISVIVNVYNGEKFIEKCLESIINQTYKNIEILIVNDGSTDNTFDLCKKYKDNRIRIITTENMGLSKSRNIGIENAKGEYLYFIDADDWVESDVIEYLYNICKKYNTKITTCNSIEVYDYNVCIKELNENVKIISCYDFLKKILLGEDATVPIWNKLLKKDLFNNIRFEDRIINDLSTTYKLVIAAERIAYSNQIKYYYLKHRNAITVKYNYNTNRMIDIYKVAVERYKYIKKIYPNFIENDAGLLRSILKVYLTANKQVEDYLNNQNAIQYFRELFSFKILTSSIRFKEKIKLLLFLINPKLYRKSGKWYREHRYKYKM